MDVAIVSLGTTLGLRHADQSLAELLREAGATCQVLPVDLRRLATLRRGMLLTDVVEAFAARRTAAPVRAGSFVFSSVTAALLQQPREHYAVRFDSLAALNRPGRGGAWQRRREIATLRSAQLLLPWSRAGGEAAASLVGASPPSVVLPPPVEDLAAPGASRDLDAVAYAANPEKRGLDLLCRAWQDLAPRQARLLVGGLDATAARRYLRRASVAEPETVEWLGVLPRREWLELVSRARLFVDASRQEEWGLAQMEALAGGTPLVTVPSEGTSEALPLARRLAPSLVATERTAHALSTAIGHGLAMDTGERRTYAEQAARLLAPYRRERLRDLVADEVLPALLR